MQVAVNTFTYTRACETHRARESGGRRRPQREAVTVLPPCGPKRLCLQLALVQVLLTSIKSFHEEHTLKFGTGIIKEDKISESNASKEFYGLWRLGWQKRTPWERCHKSFTALLLGDWLNLQLLSSLQLETLGSSASRQ